MVLPDQIWVGLSDEDYENRFFWLDGKEATKSEARWAPKEPNNYGSGEDCAVMNPRSYGEMNDIKCTNIKVGLCEKKYER